MCHMRNSMLSRQILSSIIISLVTISHPLGEKAEHSQGRTKSRLVARKRFGKEKALTQASTFLAPTLLLRPVPSKEVTRCTQAPCTAADRKHVHARLGHWPHAQLLPLVTPPRKEALSSPMEQTSFFKQVVIFLFYPIPHLWKENKITLYL